MHDYLRAVGFSSIKNKKEYMDVIQNVLEEPTDVFMLPCTADSSFGGMGKAYAEGLGIMAFGEFSKESDLEVEFSFPYIVGRETSFTERITVEKQLDKESYMGVCDEVNLGVSLIFQLLNIKDFIEYKDEHGKFTRPVSVALSALSTHGKIILPVYKDEEHK